MISTAKQGNIPKFVEMVYHINKENGNQFWSDKTLKHEHEMLMTEWEPDNHNKYVSRYTKVLYGTKFAIQFEK